jgi:hypothetical protein
LERAWGCPFAAELSKTTMDGFRTNLSQTAAQFLPLACQCPPEAWLANQPALKTTGRIR